MLKTYLFGFGYESLRQYRNNATYGWDDEFSTGLWILSPSAEAAVAWGRIIAERFVASLFEGRSEKSYSWSAAKFADWIVVDSGKPAATDQVVAIGEMPDLALLGHPGDLS